MTLDPDLLLSAYAIGMFPMAERHDAPEIYWVEPKRRGTVPLDHFHLPRSLAKVLRRDHFAFTADRAFDEVIRACAEPAPGREETWINQVILDAYGELHRRGTAHSIECWHEGQLAGGLYGVRLGGAFFGESMFTRVRDASKASLACLVARLRVGGFRLLDAQFLTDHLAQFGAFELSRQDYRSALSLAISQPGDFFALERLAAEQPLGYSPGGDPGEGDGLEGRVPDEGAPGEAARAVAALPFSSPAAISGKLIAQLLTQTS
jgi:leucyl/phenylalanyl-tRNA--protein transferase